MTISLGAKIAIGALVACGVTLLVIDSLTGLPFNVPWAGIGSILLGAGSLFSGLAALKASQREATVETASGSEPHNGGG